MPASASAGSSGKLPIGVIGEVGDLRYNYEQLGAGPETLKALADGSGSFFETLKAATHPLIIIGQGALSRSTVRRCSARRRSSRRQSMPSAPTGTALLCCTRLPPASAASISASCRARAARTSPKCWARSTCCSCSAPTRSIWPKTGEAFVVYIGTHGDEGAHRADVILPGAAYTEKSGTYVNTEGRVQLTNRAGFAPGNAKEDWAILRALSDVLGKKLPFDSLAALAPAALCASIRIFAASTRSRPGDAADIDKVARLGGRLNKGVFASPVKDFYLTNPIARASAVMAECSALAKSGFKQAAE